MYPRATFLSFTVDNNCPLRYKEVMSEESRSILVNFNATKKKSYRQFILPSV